MKVTLQSGRELDFTQEEIEELKAILGKNISSEATENVSMAKIAKPPVINKWFEVKPLSIDQTLFQNKRKDEKQEEKRQIILEAFSEVKYNPEKYAKNFKTMISNIPHACGTPAVLREYAKELGYHMADWVEQAMEWAQRIANGESWETVCNKPDSVKWPRIVEWKFCKFKKIGGSYWNCAGLYPASHISEQDYEICDSTYDDVVTLLVDYDEETSTI